MTPVERLRHAAEILERVAQDAAGGPRYVPWQPHPDEATQIVDADGRLVWLVDSAEGVDAAAHIVLNDPSMAIFVAEWLREAAGLAEEIGEMQGTYQVVPPGLLRLKEKALDVADYVINKAGEG